MSLNSIKVRLTLSLRIHNPLRVSASESLFCEIKHVWSELAAVAPQLWHGTTPTGHPQRSSDPRSYVAISVHAGQGLTEYIHRNLHRLGGIDVVQEFGSGWSNEKSALRL